MTVIRVRTGESLTRVWSSLRQRSAMAGDPRRIRAGDNLKASESLVAMRRSAPGMPAETSEMKKLNCDQVMLWLHENPQIENDIYKEWRQELRWIADGQSLPPYMREVVNMEFTGEEASFFCSLRSAMAFLEIGFNDNPAVAAVRLYMYSQKLYGEKQENVPPQVANDLIDGVVWWVAEELVKAGLVEDVNDNTDLLGRIPFVLTEFALRMDGEEFNFNSAQFRREVRDRVDENYKEVYPGRYCLQLAYQHLASTLQSLYLTSRGWTPNSEEAQTYFNDIKAARRGDRAAIEKLQIVRKTQLRSLIIKAMFSAINNIERSNILVRHLKALYPDDLRAQAGEARKLLDLDSLISSALSQDELSDLGNRTALSLCSQDMTKQTKFVAKFLHPEDPQGELNHYVDTLIDMFSDTGDMTMSEVAIKMPINLAFTLRELFPDQYDTAGFVLGQMLHDFISTLPDSPDIRFSPMVYFIKFISIDPAQRAAVYVAAVEAAGTSPSLKLDNFAADILYKNDPQNKAAFLKAAKEERSRNRRQYLAEEIVALPLHKITSQEVLEMMEDKSFATNEKGALLTVHVKSLLPEDQIDFIFMVVDRIIGHIENKDAADSKVRFISLPNRIDLAIKTLLRCYSAEDETYILGQLIGILIHKCCSDPHRQGAILITTMNILFPNNKKGKVEKDFAAGLWDTLNLINLDPEAKKSFLVGMSEGFRSVFSNRRNRNQAVQRFTECLRDSTMLDEQAMNNIVTRVLRLLWVKMKSDPKRKRLKKPKRGK